MFEAFLGQSIALIKGVRPEKDRLALKKVADILHCCLVSPHGEGILPSVVVPDARVILRAVDLEDKEVSSAEKAEALKSIQAAVQEDTYVGLYTIVVGNGDFNALVAHLEDAYKSLAKAEAHCSGEARVMKLLTSLEEGNVSAEQLSDAPKHLLEFAEVRFM